MAKLKPILFNTDMVEAILDGRKTVTRRVANINTEIQCNDGTTDHEFVLDNFNPCYRPTGFVCRKCGFGVAPPHSRDPVGTSLFRPRYLPGDILYVRETWRVNSASSPPRRCNIGYKAGGDATFDEIIALPTVKREWKPSIHMPKKAARIFLWVTHVRVERLQDITADECPMEGVWPLAACTVGERESYYKTAFSKLWDSTVKPSEKPSYGWDANPWVWVIKFEKISREEAMKEEKQ